MVEIYDHRKVKNFGLFTIILGTYNNVTCHLLQKV